MKSTRKKATARKWTKRRIVARLAELERMPKVARNDGERDLLLEVIEEGSPAQQAWWATKLLEAVLLPISVPERHKFLNELYKNSLN
jgi:hypothetical protein